MFIEGEKQLKERNKIQSLSMHTTNIFKVKLIYFLLAL